MTKFWRFFFLVSLINFSACGGGGSSTTETGLANPSYSDPAVQNMFETTNAIRTMAGGGKFLQNLSLDRAAKQHAEYLINNKLTGDGSYLYSLQENGQWGGHYQSGTKPGFSGATPQARASAAGYVGEVSEMAVFGAKSAADCIASIENSTYHLIQLMSPYVDIGMYFSSSNLTESACVMLVGLSKNSTGSFTIADQYVKYPSDNQANVSTTFRNQAERPIPAPDLKVTGRPVLFSFYNFNNKVISATELVIHNLTIEDDSGFKVPIRILTSPGVQTDGPALIFDENIGSPGFILALPIKPLLPNTTYKAKLSAAIAGKVVIQQWTFKTGAPN